MKTFASALLFLSTALASAASHADDIQPVLKRSELTQSQLALDHGPRAQVTPAVKRVRLAAAKTAPVSGAAQIGAR